MSSSSFVYTLPLKVSRKEEKVLNKRFDAARQLYNACLGESLRRLDLMRQAKTYQYARKCKKKKERNDFGSISINIIFENQVADSPVNDSGSDRVIEDSEVIKDSLKQFLKEGKQITEWYNSS